MESHRNRTEERTNERVFYKSAGIIKRTAVTVVSVIKNKFVYGITMEWKCKRRATHVIGITSNPTVSELSAEERVIQRVLRGDPPTRVQSEAPVQ